MTHKQKLIQILQQKGFEPSEDAALAGRIALGQTPDPDQPEAKPAKPALAMWLELTNPNAEAPQDITQGVTLAHEDLRRTLYYLGKAVGTEDAMLFFKAGKHAMQRALFAAGVIAQKPAPNWEDTEMEEAFPSGW